MRAAKQSGANAIHPGNGLLSESPDFIDDCVKAGTAFIGPCALGDRACACKEAVAAGVPIIPAM